MNYFQRPKTLKRKPNKTKYSKDIVSYGRTDRLVKAGLLENGELDTENFIVEEKVVETERINRQDYINSFREDVGIENILKKVALSGDTTLLNRVKRDPLPLAADGKEIIQDITPLQEGIDNVGAIGDNMRKTFAALPKDLVADRSLEDFLKGCTQEEIYNFAKNYVDKHSGGNQDVSK